MSKDGGGGRRRVAGCFAGRVGRMSRVHFGIGYWGRYDTVWYRFYSRVLKRPLSAPCRHASRSFRVSVPVYRVDDEYVCSRNVHPTCRRVCGLLWILKLWARRQRRRPDVYYYVTPRSDACDTAQQDKTSKHSWN